MRLPGRPTYSVLYVEDNDTTRNALVLHLEDWGYRVTTAGTATEGLKHLLEKHFDIIVLDNWLPDLDGTELCRQIRRTDETIPIVFYSMAEMGGEDIQALHAGASAYVLK